MSKGGLIKYIANLGKPVKDSKQLYKEFRTKENFINFLKHYDNILVLTGAGISTESGLPDYRSQDKGLLVRSTYRPIIYSEFIKNDYARKRYWARNFIGWPQFSAAIPNISHNAIVKLEVIGKLSGVVTQNVDGLHYKAGNSSIIELHGNAFWVSCLNCKATQSRWDFQKTLEALNPYTTYTSNLIRPDGDVEISEEFIEKFVLPDCEHCGGMLKPTVVFFGENVPPERVKKVENLVEKSDALLVLGTTLSTLSSYRIVKQAFDLCKFICLVNIGPTRGDKLVDLLINGNCSDYLSCCLDKKEEI